MAHPLTPARFTIDSLDGEIFDGFTRGETWNGWAVPYFTLAQLVQVGNAFTREWARNGEGRCVATPDGLFVEEGDGTQQEAWPVQVGDVTYYRCDGWIWAEVQEDDPCDDRPYRCGGAS